MPLFNVPIEFQGTEEQCQANFKSHCFVSHDTLDYNCSVCDCKPWHKAAFYQCGVEPPRETVRR